MSEQKHTPGEWYYEHGTGDHYHILAPDGTNIASTCDRMDRSSAAAKSMEEDEANARLITASPDLLAACRQVIVLLDIGTEEGFSKFGPTYLALRDAIEKATGE